MPQQEIEIHWILAVIRRWWWIIFLMAFLSTVTAFVVISRMPPVYEASATLMIAPAQNSTASQYSDLMASQQLALTYSQMLKDRPVLATVTAQLGLKEPAGVLANNIQASPVRDTQLIRLTVSDSDPARAAGIANLVAQTFKARVELLSAERYAPTIKNAEERVNNLQTQVDDFEAKIKALRTQKVEKDVSLANKQAALDKQLQDQQALQNSQQQLELTIAGVTGNAYVFEPIQVITNRGQDNSVASAVVSVGKIPDIGGTATKNGTTALAYGQMILKTPMLEKIIKDLNLRETPGQLLSKISLEPVEGTQLIRLSVTDPEASQAETIENALVDAFLKQIKGLLAEPYLDQLTSIQTKLDESTRSISAAQSLISDTTAEISQLDVEIGQQETLLAESRADLRGSQKDLEDMRLTAAASSDTVVISEPAQAPVNPIRNNMLYIGVAGFVGLAIGAGLAFFLTFIDDRIRTDQDVRKEFDLPVLGTIGRFNGKGGELVMQSQPSSISADDFRVLCAHIRLLHEKHGIHKLLITSPTPMEGKSTITSNLAVALARTGLNVIAIDADLRLPRLHEIFGLNQEDGLVKSLSSGYVNGCLQDTHQARLKVLTSGGTPVNPAEMLTSPYLGTLLKELAKSANIILIDCPPVLTAADATLLVPEVDGVLLVLKAGKSESQAAQSTVAAMREVKANLVGVVLNAVAGRKEGYYRYYRNAASKRKSQLANDPKKGAE